MRRSHWLAAVLALALSVAAARPAPACPNCKEAVSAQPSEVDGMSRGYNWSVLLMLVMPFTMLGTGAFVIVRASRLGILPEM